MDQGDGAPMSKLSVDWRGRQCAERHDWRCAEISSRESKSQEACSESPNGGGYM